MEDADADEDVSSLFVDKNQDFSALELKVDHEQRPVWVTPTGRVLLETFSPIYSQAYDFLIGIAEPVSRPHYIHEYQITVCMLSP